MPRDDLSIDGAFRNIKTMPLVELQDTAAVLDDFVNRVANLPAEIQFMRDEICDKERGEKACEDVINSRDSSIQKWIKINTALIPNPKEDLLRKSARENFDKMKLLQEKKCAYALKSQQAMDRHIKYLDTQIKSLQDRNEFPTDADIPSLLHRSSSSDLTLDRVSVAKATVISGQSTNSTSGHGTPRLPGQPAGIVRAMSMQATPQHANNSPAPASPAAAALLAGQRARESSVGAVNKRQRLIGGSVPINSSSLARHSSMGPGTPKAGTPTSMRAGSAGPGSRKTISKKQAPHLKGGARKRKPGKSGLSRVRSGNRNSPSTNDSELSEAESGTADDEDEISTPPAGTKNGDGDADMADGDEDDGTDDKKYCICQSVSFGDMVACDNDKCALEWFHWGCVGLKVEPLGAWLCPLCVKTAGDKKKGKKEESG